MADMTQTSGSEYGLAGTGTAGKGGRDGDGSDIASLDDQDGYFDHLQKQEFGTV